MFQKGTDEEVDLQSGKILGQLVCVCVCVIVNISRAFAVICKAVIYIFLTALT